MTKANPNRETDFEFKPTLKGFIIFSSFLAFLMIPLVLLNTIGEQDIASGRVCGDMLQTLSPVGYNCCTSCEEADMKYAHYEYDTSMFHTDLNECHCLDNNTYVQIW